MPKVEFNSAGETEEATLRLRQLKLRGDCPPRSTMGRLAPSATAVAASASAAAVIRWQKFVLELVKHLVFALNLIQRTVIESLSLLVANPLRKLSYLLRYESV